jgi:hypothetical protein
LSSQNWKRRNGIGFKQGWGEGRNKERDREGGKKEKKTNGPLADALLAPQAASNK